MGLGLGLGMGKRVERGMEKQRAARCVCVLLLSLFWAARQNPLGQIRRAPIELEGWLCGVHQLRVGAGWAATAER